MPSWLPICRNRVGRKRGSLGQPDLSPPMAVCLGAALPLLGTQNDVPMVAYSVFNERKRDYGSIPTSSKFAYAGVVPARTHPMGLVLPKLSLYKSVHFSGKTTGLITKNFGAL